ncbi:O-antigen ligase family protein [Halobacillus mangrovi]|nr:O-antigen ligase family protein [Halobacillus mangrovi]
MMINKEMYKKLLLLFIIVQPVLDILTFFSIKQFDSSLTIGIIVRVLFMGLSLLFIFFGNSSTYKKYVIPYLLILFAAVGIGLVYNFFDKPVFEPFLELQFLAKTLYFIIMFCSYLLLFTNKDQMDETKLDILKSLTIAMLIVSLTMFLSIVTGTASNTYEYGKFGFKGWFFSGNEISSIIAISFPLVYLYSLKKMDNFKQWYYFIPVLLLAIVSILIGTKVSYFAVLGASIIIVFSYVVWWLASLIKKAKNHTVNLRLIMSLVFLILFGAITPLSPSFTNVAGDVGKISEEKAKQQEEKDKGGDSEGGMSPEGEPAPDEGDIDEDVSLIESPVLRILLSSRNLFFANTLEQYKNADLVQKSFGMGYAGNYKENRKLIEMDFFDLFFSYGIIGSLLLFMPFITLAFLFIKRLFTMPLRVITPENVLLFVAIGMGSGIAFLAGHVLYAPAVNIYLALPMVLMIINLLHARSHKLS